MVFENLVKTLLDNKLMIVIGIISIIILYTFFNKSNFTGRLNVPANYLNNKQPRSFPKISQRHGDHPPLANPVVPEEIGLSQVYPQGVGVGMTNLDSEAYTPGNPGPYLTDYSIPESYGESSLTDPRGTNGANEGARVIRLISAGDQTQFKPTDVADSLSFASAYSSGEVKAGISKVSNHSEIDYNSNFNPEHNLTITTSPGQRSHLNNCEQTYPNVVKYKDFCITEGDIPYGEVVNGKVNPRLVSRWESFTGDYSRAEALRPIDGLLYPTLNVLTN